MTRIANRLEQAKPKWKVLAPAIRPMAVPFMVLGKAWGLASWHEELLVCMCTSTHDLGKILFHGVIVAGDSLKWVKESMGDEKPASGHLL